MFERETRPDRSLALWNELDFWLVAKRDIECEEQVYRKTLLESCSRSLEKFLVQKAAIISRTMYGENLVNNCSRGAAFRPTSSTTPLEPLRST